MEHLPNPNEAVTVLDLIIKTIAATAGTYTAAILGIEIGGRIYGYTGRGIELHQAIVKALLDVFNKKRK